MKAYAVAKHVMEHPGSTAKDVAKALELSMSHTRDCLVRCEGLGWIKPTHRHNAKGAPSLAWVPTDSGES